MADIEASKTSPAKTLPNKRKDKLATFAISPTISIIPTKAYVEETIYPFICSCFSPQIALQVKTKVPTLSAVKETNLTFPGRMPSVIKIPKSSGFGGRNKYQICIEMAARLRKPA